MNKKRVWLLTAAIGLGLPAVAAAEGEVPDRGPIPFSAFDHDGDGVVSREEFHTTRGDRMSQRAEEGRPMRGHATAPTFEDFDSNGDGVLSEDELAAGQGMRRQQRPGMGQGGGPGMRQGMGRGMGQGGGMGQGMGRGGGRGMGQGRGMANAPAFADYDLDGDGSIGREEFQQAQQERMRERAEQGYTMRNRADAPTFDDLDTDGDGRVSNAEFAEHQAQRRGRMAPQ